MAPVDTVFGPAMMASGYRTADVGQRIDMAQLVSSEVKDLIFFAGQCYYDGMPGSHVFIWQDKLWVRAQNGGPGKLWIDNRRLNPDSEQRITSMIFFELPTIDPPYSEWPRRLTDS